MLDTFILVIFWLSLMGLVHTYVLFPVLMRLMLHGANKKLPETKLPEPPPVVSILIAARNEEKVIEQKIKSIIDNTYPKSCIEILVGSDQSDDDTDFIVKRLSEKNNFIKLIRFPQRIGKPGIINSLAKQSQGDILIITDANVFFSTNTLEQIIIPFSNSKIGLVDTHMMNIGMMKSGISFQEQTYIQTEVLTKYAEGKIWGSMMGPFGGCYALRKSLFKPIPENFLVDDFYINMKVLEQGYYCINSLHAIVYEEPAHQLLVEFKRKVRIATGNFQNLAQFGYMLFKGKGIGFSFFSHKVLRWFGPIMLLLLYASSIYLSLQQGPDVLNFYTIISCLLSLSFLLLIIERMLATLNIHIKLLKLNTHFLIMNAALLKGLFRFLTGVKSGIWEPTVRS